MTAPTLAPSGIATTTAVYWITLVSFLTSVALTPLVRDAFARRKLVDRPDGYRKLHAQAVPRAGGIPIVISYLVAYATWVAVFDASGIVPADRVPFVVRLLPAAGIIFLIGLADDLWGLAPRAKLCGQATGAVAAVWGGVSVSAVAGFPLSEPWSTVVTVVWLVGCSNAFNLIDGLDGLAAGMGLFSALTIFIAAVLGQDAALMLATLPLCGSLLGFLRYNFNPASVFLGDSGSLLIGFLLGCYGAIWSQKSATLLGMTAPLMAVAVPLLEVAISVLRRWLRGQPIFVADRDHIHHRLLAMGLTHRNVVIVLYLTCGMYAVLSLLAGATGLDSPGLILVIFAGVTWAGIRRLGYVEFGLAGQVLFGGGLRRMLHEQIALQGLRRSIRESRDAGECWKGLSESAREFGFTRLDARLNRRQFHWVHKPGQEAAGLQLRVTLPGGDYVNLTRPLESTRGCMTVGDLLEVLHRELAPRLGGAARAAEPGDGRTLSLIHLASSVGPATANPLEPGEAAATPWTVRE
jgi:UDP-GlcNAc:undecaprenyl-phosphate GlcNAc-1-phosphate transferase